MMKKWTITFLLGMIFFNVTAQTPNIQKPEHIKSTILRNVWLIDGTGTPARKTNVHFTGPTIDYIGSENLNATDTFDVNGLFVLAPGFIDTHSHIVGSLEKYPEALADVSQGVTTIVSGQDGYGSYVDSIKAGIARKPIAINIATYTGHTDLREEVMGKNRLNQPATEKEIADMQGILLSELKKGSLGLSTGLEYEGAYFSSKNEVIQLAKTAASENGRYISHIRSEDIDIVNALTEIMEIGKQAKIPVQISHIKIALKDMWGKSPGIIAWLQDARLQGVDITADCYPYEYWHSTLKVLFPKTDYTNPESAQFAVDHTFDPTQSILIRFAPNPNYAGKTISAIAEIRKEKPAQTLMGLIAEADVYEKAHPDANGVEAIIAKSMIDEDVINFLKWPNTNICSDGSNGGHPRGYGSFTRVLGNYVRDKKIMPLETAIQKMTSLSAEHVGIKKRGIITEGYNADLVLFNPETVKDNASFTDSKALSNGIITVWVNGVRVFDNKKATNQYPGKFISR
ncbi:MAG: amidohydrolase family protein [Bacteroidota bacterium]